MLLLSLFILMLIADFGLSEQMSLTLGDTNSNDPSLKTVVIKGIAKYKPGGSAMILSLLVQGEPGIMPAGNIQTQPGISTTASPSTGPSSPPKSTASSSGSSSSGATGVKPTKGPSSGTPSSSSASSGPTSTPLAGSSTSVPAPSSSTPAGSSTSVPGTSPSPSTASAGFKDYEQEGLDLHNKFREVHGSQKMKLNKKMCEEAQAYAEKIAASGNMEHSNKDERNGEGENLSMGCKSTGAQTVKEAVTNWYNEVCHPGYNFDQGRGQGGTGHFTQVVWNDSVELGIGRAESSKGGLQCAYIVGRYKPLGNFNTGNNDYKKNVKQGSFDRNSYCATVNNNSPSRDQMNNQHQSKSISQILKRSFHFKRHH